MLFPTFGNPASAIVKWSSLSAGKVNDDDYDDIIISTTDALYIFYNNFPDFTQVSLDSLYLGDTYIQDMNDDNINDVGIFDDLTMQGIPQLKVFYNSGNGVFEDFDIFGIDYEGNYIYAQVTFYTKDKCEDKIKKLKKYAGKKNKLIFFCNCDKKEFDEENRIFFIPVNLVESWLKKNPEYKRKLFEGLQIN